ncbi:MAG: group II truncated hemoglobin [Gammaproteobacteria bacterium]|nr:group II truncated hemoglobin [Gammaproteobacteria bacterium]
MPEMYPTPYELIGGDKKVRELVVRFYELMDSLPEADETRKMHPDDLSGSIDKLYKFLSGWFGGPSIYIEEFGHPRLRARHLPFVIDDRARDQWLMCMFQAMDDVGIDKKIQMSLKQNFSQMANHMRNQ